MAEPPTRRFPARDGAELAYREIGEGRPLVLVHGFTGSGLQWISHGPAETIARSGHRVILPDMRGHGDSARPHDPAAFPPDVLADDTLALIGQLGLVDYGAVEPEDRRSQRVAASAVRGRWRARWSPGPPGKADQPVAWCGLAYGDQFLADDG